MPDPPWYAPSQKPKKRPLGAPLAATSEHRLAEAQITAPGVLHRIACFANTGSPPELVCGAERHVLPATNPAAFCVLGAGDIDEAAGQFEFLNEIHSDNASSDLCYIGALLASRRDQDQEMITGEAPSITQSLPPRSRTR